MPQRDDVVVYYFPHKDHEVTLGLRTRMSLLLSVRFASIVKTWRTPPGSTFAMVGARRAALEGSATLPGLACFEVFCTFACFMTPAAKSCPHRHLSQAKSRNCIDSRAAGDVHDNMCSTSLSLAASGASEMGTKARGVPSF